MLTKRKQIVESIQFLQWTEEKHSLHQLKNQEWDKRWYSEFSETHNSVQECLDAFGRFNNS